MLLAPQNLDAAYWFSASTDLFATVFVLAALLGGRARARPGLAAAAALAAYLSKESAYVLPLLALLVLRGVPWRRRLVAGRAAVRAACRRAGGAQRACCTDGAGRATRAPGSRPSCFRLPAGSPAFSPATACVPEPLAFGLGTAVVALAAFAAIRGRRQADGARGLPFAFCALAALPLLAAGWAVGARYFYLPAVGLAWAVAEALAGAGGAARVTIARRPAARGRPAGRPAARRRGLVRAPGRGGAAGGRRRA